MTTIPDRSTRALTTELVALRTEVDALKRSSRPTQLDMSSIEAGSVKVRDSQGNLMGVIGMTTTGTSDEVFHVQSFNPNPPAAPPAPILEPFNRGVMVSHDGSAQPVDYDYHNVYWGTVDSYANATLMGRMYGADAMPIAPLEGETPIFVWLTQVNMANRESQPSPSATATPSQVVAEAVLDGIVDELALADAAVSAAKVKTNAIQEIHIDTAAITAHQVAVGAIKEVAIDTGAITAAKLAGEAVTETAIAPGAVTSPKIVAGAIQAGHITAGAVTAGSIAAGAVTADKIAANSIEAGHIAAGQIFADHIGAGSITADKLVADSITAHQIQANAITAQEISANAIYADHIAADQIQANHIAANTITAGHINALAVTADKISANAINAGHVQAGAITAAKLEAVMVLATRIIVGTANGNRLELHPTRGMEGWSNGVRRLWFDVTTGNLLAKGTWATGSVEEGKPYIEVQQDGTQVFVAANNLIAGKIENNGTSGLSFRSGKQGTDAGYLFLNSNYVGINWGTVGGIVPASFGADRAGIQAWGRLVGIRYEERFAGDGTQPRLFILGTQPNGSDTGQSTLHFTKRSQYDNEPLITAIGQNCSILFESGKVKITTAAGNAFAAIDALVFNTQCSEETKEDIRPVAQPAARTELDVIEGAPVFEWAYKDDQPPPAPVATDVDGEPFLARVRNPAITSDRRWRLLAEDHPDKWVWEEISLDHINHRQERHFSPLAEDLAALNPDLVSADGMVSVMDLVGVLWGAVDKLSKHVRRTDEILKARGIVPPPWPGKNDVAEGVGRRVPGRTRRQIDRSTGQAR